jgi:hypothetical protein
MIKELFRKDIHRTIEGVVKADNLSDEAVFQEVDEYVITDELSKKFEDFFDVYSGSIGKPTESIGVWISGFFGSGKSHLLKILSYILSSKRLESDLIGELFLEKVEDTMLKANIQKALKLKTDTILFNIDQKTDTGANRRSDDAILSVFMKVFNEHRGYYPKQGYIAAFEKQLDKDGLYEPFKEIFAKESGNSWEIGREQFEWEVDNIAKAVSEIRSISYESAKVQVEKLDSNYSLSVEDFAKKIKEYVDTQEKGYRLIFMVDEVGQYIGDNTRLMLNLQTIVETLATKCQGSAWVVVTSQSAVAELVDTNKLAETDFSKILGRFKVKMNLTSQNANEVIQKRLLDKKEEYKPELETLYTKHQNSLASIIYFSERGRSYSNYKDADDFILTYPFIPYQLDLFQSCIRGLSKNEAFQGRHQSVGERSMLDVIQSVAKAISDQDVGSLASFDYFYDGIENIILPEAQKLMTTAKNSLDPFSLKVLKVLFMVKYVNEFNATIDHITTLLVDSLEIDIAATKEAVKKALGRLLNEVYIQKVGENYEFLTDKEKDIENEIKAVSVELPDLAKEMADWLYDNLIGISKFRYLANKQDYAFSRKMDNIRVKGKEEELSLNILTPLGDEYDDEKLIHKSFADNDLIIALHQDFDFERELRLYLQTKKYIPQKNSGNISPTEKQILIQKGEDNNIRRRNLLEKLKEQFTQASIYFNGKRLEHKASEPKTIVENSFNEIMPSFYTNLGMLTQEYKEQDIKTILNNKDDLLTGTGDALTESELTMFNQIKRMAGDYQTISVNKLLEQFSAKPYGWYQAAIMCQIASLYVKKAIDLTEGHLLDRTEVYTALTNNRKFASTLIKPSKKVDNKILKKAKSVVGELFPEIALGAAGSREIWQLVRAEVKKIVAELEGYKRYNYIFSNALNAPIETLLLIDVEYDDFYDALLNNEDTLLDMKEDTLDLLLEFMRGSQKKIYDEIISFMKRNEANLFHIKSEKLNDLYAIVADMTPYQARKIQKANESFDLIQAELNVLLSEAKEEANEKLDTLIKSLQEDSNFEKVDADKRVQVIRPLQAIKESIECSRDIDFIYQRVSEYNFDEYKRKALERMDELLPMPAGDTPATLPSQKTLLSQIKPKGFSRLKTAEEVSAYIKVLEQKMLDEVEEGRQIIV